MFKIEGNSELSHSSRFGVEAYEHKQHHMEPIVNNHINELVESYMTSKDETIYHDKEKFTAKTNNNGEICIGRFSKRDLENMVYDRVKDRKKREKKVKNGITTIIIIIVLIVIGYLVWKYFLRDWLNNNRDKLPESLQSFGGSYTQEEYQKAYQEWYDKYGEQYYANSLNVI